MIIQKLDTHRGLESQDITIDIDTKIKSKLESEWETETKAEFIWNASFKFQILISIHLVIKSRVTLVR